MDLQTTSWDTGSRRNPVANGKRGYKTTIRLSPAAWQVVQDARLEGESIGETVSRLVVLAPYLDALSGILEHFGVTGPRRIGGKLQLPPVELGNGEETS